MRGEGILSKIASSESHSGFAGTRFVNNSTSASSAMLFATEGFPPVKSGDNRISTANSSKDERARIATSRAK